MSKFFYFFFKNGKRLGTWPNFAARADHRRPNYFNHFFMKKQTIATAALLFALLAVRGQTLFDPTLINKIEVQFPFANWDLRMDTSETGADDFTVASWVKINGTQFDSAGVKWRGNQNYDAAQAKNPMHIELNTVIGGQSFEGQNDIYLNNGKADPAFVREALTFGILGNYMDVARAGFAEVWVNGTFLGLYTTVEEVGSRFLKDHFDSSTGAFFKCAPENPGADNLSNLAYLGPQKQLYYPKYEKRAVNDATWDEIVDLCDTLANHPEALDKVLDPDRCLWMHAANASLVNLNSYTGGFSENYYIYRDEWGRFNPIPTDLNEAFGGHAVLDPPIPLSTTQMAQIPVAPQENNAKRPLIKQILADARYRKMYVAHFRTIFEEQIQTDSFNKKAVAMQAVLTQKMAADVNKFYGFGQFLGALTSTEVSAVSGFDVPGPSNLMADRLVFLKTQADFLKNPPVITASPTVSPANPSLGATAWFSIKTTGATAAFLGFQKKKHAPFTRIQMFDDGQHNDGAAGDGNFGVSLLVDDPVIRYYFWVENGEAGRFLPARAEHEFFKLLSEPNKLSPGSVVINEVMAANGSTITDPAGQFDDWIELHNRTGAEINLSRCFLTNKLSNPDLWEIPDGTVIPANGYLLIWADADSGQPGLHANFKLKASKDQVKLSDETLFAVDSVEFKDQVADVSWARIPNGSGPFQFEVPTPLMNNSSSAVADFSEKNSPIFYPNPTSGTLYFFEKNLGGTPVQVFSSVGKLVFDGTISASSSLDLGQLPSGLFLMKIGSKSEKMAYFVKI